MSISTQTTEQELYTQLLHSHTHPAETQSKHYSPSLRKPAQDVAWMPQKGEEIQRASRNLSLYF